MTTRENKSIKILGIMPLQSRLQGRQMPTKNYLVTQIWKQPGRNISVSQVLEDQRKFDGCICRWNCRRATFNQDDRRFFFSSGSLFNCEEKGKTLLSVISWKLGVVSHILKVGGRLSYFENWGTVEIFCKVTSNLSKNFTMKGTMSLAIALVYKFVVHCYKTLPPWDYPWLFGFLLYLERVARMGRSIFYPHPPYRRHYSDRSLTLKFWFRQVFNLCWNLDSAGLDSKFREARKCKRQLLYLSDVQMIFTLASSCSSIIERTPLHCLFCILDHFLTVLMFSKEVASSIFMRTFNTSNVCKRVTFAKFFPCHFSKLLACSSTLNGFRMLSLVVVRRMRRSKNQKVASLVV